MKMGSQKVSNTLYSPSTAVANFLLMFCCLYGENYQDNYLFSPVIYAAIWSMFWANWTNLNKVFLHGYLWFGICGTTAALGVFRFGNFLRNNRNLSCFTQVQRIYPTP